MSKKMKLAGLILGAALTTTTAFAGNGSCGAGKCGGDMKKEAQEKKSGACGTGKCGSSMKNEMNNKSNGHMNNEMKEMKQEAKDMKKGACGSGKCGGDMKKSN